MPRQPRLNIPGLLHHVIARGIERGIIFRDDTDCHDFLDRLCNLLAETGTECFAWALIPNHFHLLLRPQRTSLSSVMSRLLTGYAVTYNRRHERSGHLFQNRYKSIICEEDVYFMELVRYIHLNPLRANLIPDIDSLDSYPWCGHAELMEKQPGVGIHKDIVLGLFGEKLGPARRAYHKFIVDGIKIDMPPDLNGGGLRRSQAHNHTLFEKNHDSDDRILGSSEFVTNLRQAGLLEDEPMVNMTLVELQKLIEVYYRLKDQGLFSRGRQNEAAAARNLFCYCGVRKLGGSGAEVGRHLNIGSSSVTRSLRKGEQLLDGDPELRFWVDNNLKPIKQ